MRVHGLLASTTLLSIACFQAEPSDDGESGTGTDGSGGSTTTTTASSTNTDTSSAATSASTSATDTTATSGMDSTGEADATATDGGTDAESSGGIMCGQGEMDCGGECVDPQTNAAHCGACQHDCLGGECAAGVCGAVQLATGKGRLFMVQLDADHLYYGGDGVDVGRIDKDGANDTLLDDAGMDLNDREWCYQSAITDTHVVWGNDWVQPGVRGCALPGCGGGVTTQVMGLNMYTMVFNQANDTLYFDQSGTTIMQKVWGGGAATNFATNQTSPRELAADDGFIYWGNGNDMTGYSIRKMPVGGGAVASLVTGRVEGAAAIDVGPDAIYWAESDLSGDVFMAPLPNGIGGSDPEVFANGGGTNIYDIHTDDTHVYWITRGVGLAGVYRCPLDGCDPDPELLDGTANDPWAVNTDDVAVYWVTEDGQIMKIAK
jgi:hypothetical protein